MVCVVFVLWALSRSRGMVHITLHRAQPATIEANEENSAISIGRSMPRALTLAAENSTAERYSAVSEQP